MLAVDSWLTTQTTKSAPRRYCAVSYPLSGAILHYLKPLTARLFGHNVRDVSEQDHRTARSSCETRLLARNTLVSKRHGYSQEKLRKSAPHQIAPANSDTQLNASNIDRVLTARSTRKWLQFGCSRCEPFFDTIFMRPTGSSRLQERSVSETDGR